LSQQKDQDFRVRDREESMTKKKKKQIKPAIVTQDQTSPSQPTPPSQPTQPAEDTNGIVSARIRSTGKQWYPVLIRFRDDQPRERYVITRGETMIGRDPRMDIPVIADLMTSRRHTSLVWENIDAKEEYPRCRVEDLQSRNGTMVNGIRIEENAALADGDTIIIGNNMFGFYIKDNHELEFEENVISLATYDSLTGLVNRRAFLGEARRLIARAIRHSSPLALSLCDIDCFKNINDTCGHGVGDAVLAMTSAIITRSFRESDVAGRLGGDEFAIIMPDCDRAQALAAIDRLRALLDKQPFCHEAGEIRITLSIGLAHVGAECNSWPLLYRGADLALYTAKRLGKNCLSEFDSSNSGWQTPG